MRSFSKCLCLTLLFATFLCVVPANAEERSGGISGTVTDSTKGALPGARIELQPKGTSVATNGQGQFFIADLPPGRYTVKVSYVGFRPYSTDVTVASGQAARVDAVLQVSGRSEEVTVQGERERGEVEAINRERTADNVVQVLPAEVITSLPNTNIADATGRLPSVSVERDEGEAKYIQIRGTEPRLNNVTVDGIHLPSPEGVRNVKLDAIPADLVDSIEVNKTLSADQDADAIGGSVNLVTKTPSDRPYLTLLGLGGYTPISKGRNQYQFAGTAGQRFGASKKFGALFGFSYDYNARGINDVEPAPTVNALPNGQNFLGPNTEDIRYYLYDRSRYGFDGTLDYKIGDMSSVYVRGLFSHFNDSGEDWIYSPSISNFITNVADPNNTCGITNVSGVQGCGGISFSDIYRKPAQQIFSTQAGARHVFGSTVLTYEVALSQANYTGGFSFVGFNGPGSADNSVAFGVDTTHPFVPKFPVLNGVNIYDPNQYTMSFADTEKDGIFERDVVGDVSVNRTYRIGSHFSVFEAGFKGWDARKTSVVDRENFNAAGGQLMTQFLVNYTDNNYYFKQYPVGPQTRYIPIQRALAPGGFNPNFVNNLPNDWDISERIWAGYAMNTISFGKLRVQTGARVEATNDDLLGNLITTDPATEALTGVSPLRQSHSYTDVFPSVQLQYAVTPNTVIRAAYGMGIARPNFGDIPPFQLSDPNANPAIPISAGNPALKPTHAQNFDLLGEHYFKPLGLIQGGVFYKDLSDPIYSTVQTLTSGPFAGQNAFIPINGPSAHLTGVEMAWQQQLSFLPHPLNGMGVRANYSYVTSRASFPVGFGRTDHPTLLRTAPNNWNFDVTYDKKGISARMGLTHNDAYIWSYGATNLKDPTGDTYLYPHTQVDAQVSYWIPRGHGLQVIASFLNLNNEVFGFYNGSERFPIQREYYWPSYMFGLKWTRSGEK